MSLQEYDLKKIAALIIVLLLLVIIILMFSQAPQDVEQHPAKPVNQTPVNTTKDLYEQKLDEITADCMSDAGIKGKEICIDLELNSFAQKQMDEEYCDLIKKDLTRESCRTSIIYDQTVLDDSPGSCKKLEDLEQQNTCIDNYYLQKSAETQNASYCLKMVDESMGTSCYDAFYYKEAMETGNCSMLKSARKKGICISHTARMNNDKTLCDTIDHNVTKSECLANFGQNEN